jgi:hypothetical protein
VSFEAWAPAAPRGCSQGEDHPCRVWAAGAEAAERARPCRAGCHSPHRPPHLPDDGPVMPSEISKRGAHPCPEGNCEGNTRPAAGGETTLMRPAAQRSRRPQSAYPPIAGPSAETNERAKGWKVGPGPGGSRGREPRDAGAVKRHGRNQRHRPRPCWESSKRSPTSKLDGRCLRPRYPGGVCSSESVHSNPPIGGGRHRMTGAAADRSGGGAHTTFGTCAAFNWCTRCSRGGPFDA